MAKTKQKQDNNISDVEIALNTIGGKWKIPIIWNLKEGEKRFRELQKSVGKITDKMLTQQLRELEKAELVERKIYPQVPPKVEYKLTLLGQSVLPVIELLEEWGSQYKSVFK
jgi:DNA-binding HxlR family transcriptional regulator